jgi:hypothetical protein
MTVQRNIKYVNRDFNSLRDQLIQYTKTYFPTTYNDFTPASPGMLFMEMAAYVGDVMSFYLDNQIQETFMQYARQTQNLYELAYLLGYKPKVTGAATATLDFYQQLPAIGNLPDFSYALTIQPNTVVKSTSNPAITFVTGDTLDFAFSSSASPTEISIYEINGTTVESFLIKKSINAISATVKTTTFQFTDPIPFATVELKEDNIIGIQSIVDSDNNTWYEVSHLGQDSVFDSIKNTNTNNPTYSTDSNVPFLLQTKQVANRFTSRFLNATTLQIQFGAGTALNSDEELVPNPNNVGLGLPFERDKLTTAFSPTNYIFTNTYGTAPASTTLTVTYLVGGGVISNIPQNDLTTVVSTTINFNNPVSDPTLRVDIFNSLFVTNPTAASGGQDGDSIQEIRQNSLVNFQNQLRTVTVDDYLLRALSLPSIYGTVAKAYAEAEKQVDVQAGQSPASVALFILTYNQNKNLTQASPAIKRNLQTYLSEYRVLNDTVVLRDAYIINIGVNFEIITLPNFNSNQVLLACIDTLKTFFSIDNWQINEPILLRDIYVTLDRIEGVQTVKNVEIVNKTGAGLGYSEYAYDTKGATINNVVYPSIDPMIFEVKYPDSDIQGRVVSL